MVENNGGLRWEHFCEREEGNAHSPPDIHYSKEPNKVKRLMRHPAPSQEPAGKGNTDAAEKNSDGGDSAIPRGQSGRERGSGRLCEVVQGKRKRAASPEYIETHSPVKLLISVFSYSALRFRSQPTRPAPILLRTIAPGAGITGTSLMPMRTR